MLRTFQDNQQYFDPDGIADALGISPATWPLAGLLWDSALILAELMVNFDIEEKRILEIGCGLGLSSLILSARGANITATDLHPEAHPNLIENTRLNKGKTIPFFQTDWKQHNEALGFFDLVIGSDVLYQPDHPRHVARFITQHTMKDSQIIVVDPGRGNLSRFGKELRQYGFTKFNPEIGKNVMQANEFKGHVHTFKDSFGQRAQ